MIVAQFAREIPHRKNLQVQQTHFVPGGSHRPGHAFEPQWLEPQIDLRV